MRNSLVSKKRATLYFCKFYVNKHLASGVK